MEKCHNYFFEEQFRITFTLIIIPREASKGTWDMPQWHGGRGKIRNFDINISVVTFQSQKVTRTSRFLKQVDMTSYLSPQVAKLVPDLLVGEQSPQLKTSLPSHLFSDKNV